MAKKLESVMLRINGKDPDLTSDCSEEAAKALGQFLVFHEYYELEIEVDPVTGTGSCRFLKPKRIR